MDINQLKFNFAIYLREIKGDEEIIYDPISDISIFQYSKEFKEFIQSQYSSTELNISTMSIGDILDLKIVNGKLVDPDKLAEEEQEASGEAPLEDNDAQIENNGEQVENNNEQEQVDIIPPQEGEETLTEGDKVNFDETSVTDLLNTLMNDELFNGAVDYDQNGEISDEELKNFFNAISKYDGDDSNVSIEDIISAVDAIYNNEYSPVQKTYYDEENDATIESSSNISNTPPSKESKPIKQATGKRQNTPEKINSSNDDGQKKNLNNLTQAQLEDELGKAQTDFSEKQTALNNIISGNTPELQELQKNIDKAYNIYQEELKNVDEAKAKQVDDLKQKIDSKEKEINDCDIEITNQETTVSTCENNYNNAVSTRKNLETTKGALQSSLSSADDEQKSSINSQISQITQEIKTATQAEEEAKKAWDEAQAKLEELKEKKEQLQSGENGLDELNNQMDILEAQINEEYPQIQQYLTDYNNAKQEYNTAKTQATAEAQTALTEQQNYVNEINTAINNKSNNNQVKNYMKNAMGEDIVEFASQFIGCNEADGSADKFLASWTTSAKTPWCAAFVQYIYEHSDYADNLPEWYSSIGNKWSCGNLYKAAKAANAQIDVNEAQAGDMVLFDWDLNGGKDHVGIIVSVENGIVTTIEGNTSDKVAYRTYKIDNPKLSFYKMT